MKLIKGLLFGILGLLALFVLAAILLVTLVDTKVYTQKVAELVKQQTGRELQIKEELSFSFFPTLGLRTGQIEFSNSEGFSPQPMLAAGHVQAGIQLLPLLSGQVQVGVIKLHDVQILLETNKSGKTNWADLSEKQLAAEGSQQAANTDPQTQSLPIQSIEIGGVEIIDSQVVIEDQQAKTRTQIDPIHIRIGRISPDQVTPVQIEGIYREDKAQQEIEVDLKLDAKMDIAASHYVLNDIELESFIHSQGPASTQEIKLNADAEIWLDKEQVSIRQLQVQLDDIELNGEMGIQSFARPVLTFDLHSERLSFDQGQSDSDDVDNDGLEEQPADAATDDRIELPVELLRSLTLDGSLSIGQLDAAGMYIEQIKTVIKGAEGLIEAKPITMSLYQGTYAGAASVDVRKSKPRYHITSQLKDIQIEALSRDLSEKKKAVIRGTTALSFALSTHGERVSTLKKNLTGNLDFSALNGALINEKLARNIEQVVALLKKREPKPAGDELVFDSLTATAKITQGVLRNEDMKLITPLIFTDGGGRVDIAEESMKYTLTTRLSDEEGSRAIPLKVKGPWDDLKYKVDLKAALKAEHQEKIDEKKQELIDKATEKLGEGLGKELGDKLKDIKLF